MRITVEDDFRESLDEPECLRLLTTTSVGRLGFTEGALPAILPVSFTLRIGHVLIAARHGSSVVDAVRRSVVAFQVDEYDPAARTGWSVTVVGPAVVIADPRLVAPMGGPPVPGRALDQLQCHIAVQLGLVRGWRMTPCPGGREPADADTSTAGGIRPAPIA